MKYTVNVQMFFSKLIDVEATNEEEAETLAKELFVSGKDNSTKTQQGVDANVISSEE